MRVNQTFGRACGTNTLLVGITVTPNCTPMTPPSPDPALEALDRRFASVAAVIATFASRHGLLVAKYSKDEPCWQVPFTHSQGGEGCVSVCLDREDGVSVVGTRHQDVYETGTRHVRRTPLHLSRPPHPRLDSLLEAALGETLAWRLDDLSPTGHDFKIEWHRRWSQSAFEQLSRRHPIPSL